MMKVSKNQQAAWDKKNTDRMDGHVANNLEREGWVKDKKTGEFYNPQEAFDAMMNKPEILAVFKRLSIR
jgi:hypothetical protein